MAHFAEVDATNFVIRVLVIPQEEESRGQDYLAHDLGLGGTWVQTSYSGRIRKQFAGIGFVYDPISDVFIAPQPFPSWSLDENHNWAPPERSPGGEFVWDEKSKSWVTA